jgi:hypothetical protein
MVSKAEAEKALRLVSQSWGKKQAGYVFFPWIDRKKQRLTGIRRKGFNEGPAFRWPADREKIINHIMAHNSDRNEHDIYWSTQLYEYPIRREDTAMTEYALFADLDKVDPNTLDEYPPTVAWESSPGNYQALWVAQQGDFLGATWPGNENQRMTYFTGADSGGWFATKLLRLPYSTNYKPDYRDANGQYPQGKVLWANGPRYLPGDFADLPEIAVAAEQLSDALAADIDGVDRIAVIARIKLKLNHKARELLNAREASGDKSDQLWYLIRCLADVGLNTAEIVSVVRETVWNKFRDRHDEVRRLIAEASKAISKRSEEVTAKLESQGALSDEDEAIRPDPTRLGFLLKNIKKPKYLVQGVLTEGACGFIAGEPKCYKSWIGLDLALSVATGAHFLGQFRVQNPGPVLYIQEEDPAPTLKNRSAKIWVNKATDKFELVHEGDAAGLYWLPPEQDEAFDPDINAYIQQGLVISDEAWQIWLDETLAKGMDDKPYRLLIIDTLMMTAGEVDENRSQEMTTKIFKPLKTLARKHNVAIQVIHHMGKSERARPGQRMLGAVANHAWAEDSIYLARSGINDIRMDLESKTVPAATYRLSDLDNTGWTPTVAPWRPDEQELSDSTPSTIKAARGQSARKKPTHPVLGALTQSATGMTTAELAIELGINRSSVHKQAARLFNDGLVEREQLPNNSNLWKIAGRS